MFDPVARNFGGFTNYLNVHPEKNAFTATKFVFEDNDPSTTSTIAGSDAYCSVANTALLMKANFPKVLPNGHDALLISMGVNSTADPASTIEAMESVAEIARARGWTIFITTIGPWKSYKSWAPFYQKGTETINEWIRSTASRGYIVIDSYKLLEDPNNPGSMPAPYTLDGLHYSAAGDTILADEANRLMTAAKGCQDRPEND